VTEQLLELGVFAHVGRALTECEARFALAETERAQGLESTVLHVRCVRRQRGAVVRSVGVAKPKRGRRAAFDAQSATMTSAMMSAAQREQVLRLSQTVMAT
jgi:hypothetical protein